LVTDNSSRSKIQAAQQAGDPRAECGIDGEVRVGLRLGIAGAAVRQGGQRGVEHVDYVGPAGGGGVVGVGHGFLSFAENRRPGGLAPIGLREIDRESMFPPSLYRFAIPS
jgi:hypothetical protein